jgi:hypothetical protein
MAVTANIAHEHIAALLAGASYATVADAAMVSVPTVQRRYRALCGSKRQTGRRPLSDAVRANVVASFDSGVPVREIAIGNRISRMTVYRIVRARDELAGV